jgi:hypothetical protein
MPSLERLYFGTRTKTEVQSNTANYTHAFGFETATDQNGFFTITDKSTKQAFETGWQRYGARTVGSYTFTPRTGSYSFGAIDPGSNSDSGTDITFTIPTGAQNAVFEVWCFCHAELDDVVWSNGWYALYDVFRVYKNGSLVYDFRWSDQNITRTEIANWDPYNPPNVAAATTPSSRPGGQGAPWGSWFQLKFTLTPGTYTFTFEYERDSGDGVGNPTGTNSHYIDDMKVTYTTQAGQVITTPAQPLVYFDGSEGYHLARQWDGAILPPLQHVEYSLPFQPGSVHEYTSIEARDFPIGLFVQCQDSECLRDKLRNLSSKLALQDGALFAEFDDFTTRELPCYLSEIDQEENSSTTGYGQVFKTILTFRAFDPFWYGPLEEFQTTATSNGTYLNNQGDFENWPIYRIFGPITNPEILLKHPDDLSDNAYIKKMKLKYTVAAGRIVTIDTRPGYKTITLDDGTNLYSTLDRTLDQMFAIPKGEWYVDLDGSDYDGTEKLVIHWREAYWGM